MALDPRAPWEVVERFERTLAAWCGAPYAVAVDSCTNALFLSLRYRLKEQTCDWDYPTDGVYIPAHTYVGVVRAAKNAGFMVEFTDERWGGEYTIKPLNVVDAAKWMRKKMYRPGTLTCLSFQAFKQLPIGRGGAILTDSPTAYDWLRRASFDGRDRSCSIAEQEAFGWGIHAYMTPPDAARGLWLMQRLKDDEGPIGSWQDYPDLRTKTWA